MVGEAVRALTAWGASPLPAANCGGGHLAVDRPRSRQREAEDQASTVTTFLLHLYRKTLQRDTSEAAKID
jgi:hypothetical protein